MPNATVENASVHEGELVGNMITFGLTLFLILGILCISTHFLRTVSQILDKKLPRRCFKVEQRNIMMRQQDQTTKIVIQQKMFRIWDILSSKSINEGLGGNESEPDCSKAESMKS